MDINKAVLHLRRKIATNKYSTEYDKKCLNQVIDFVNGTQEKFFAHHELFFKLYAYVYASFVRHYEESAFDRLPQKELHRILDRTIDNSIQDFVDAINMAEFYRSFKIIDGVPRQMGDPKTWTFRETADALKAQASKAIQNFST